MRSKALHANQCKYTQKLFISLTFASSFCSFSFFEQEIDYPRQDARFLDLSIRGICIDDQGAHHPIAKKLITSKFRSKNKEDM